MEEKFSKTEELLKELQQDEHGENISEKKEEKAQNMPEINNELFKMLEEQNILLKSENEKIKNESETLKNRYVQLLADFENLKKRTKKEIDDIKKFGITSVIKDFLPISDNFLRAVEHSKNNKNFDALFEGVELILRQFINVFENHQVKSFDCVGQQFNPTMHEALQMVVNNDVPPNTVLIEYEKGFMIADRLLRPAKVVVSQQSKETNESQSIDVNA